MNEVLMRDKVMKVMVSSGIDRVPVTLSYGNISNIVGSNTSKSAVRDAVGTLVRRNYLIQHKGNKYQTLTTTYTCGSKYDKYVVTTNESELKSSIRMTDYWSAVRTANSPEGAARALSLVNKNIDRVGYTLETLKERRSELANKLATLKRGS